MDNLVDRLREEANTAANFRDEGTPINLLLEAALKIENLEQKINENNKIFFACRDLIERINKNSLCHPLILSMRS